MHRNRPKPCPDGIALGWLFGAKEGYAFPRRRPPFLASQKWWHFLRVFKPDVRTLVGTSELTSEVCNPENGKKKVLYNVIDLEISLPWPPFLLLF